MCASHIIYVDTVWSKYDELTKKRSIVLNDRNTLESTIEELEQIKIDVLQKAFQLINKASSKY